MRSFISSVIIIAAILIGQQWVAKANAEQTMPAPAALELGVALPNGALH
jgi:hypothetical protein